MRSSDIRRELRVDPLLLCVERSQLRWFRASDHNASRRPSLEVFRARPTGRTTGRPRTHWRDYISHLALEHLEELESVAGEK